jgi:ubiquinone/menaquinone biosynthesis C-methylase UbiE
MDNNFYLKKDIQFTKHEQDIIDKYNIMTNDDKENENLLFFMNDGCVELDENNYPKETNELKEIEKNKKYLNWKYQANVYRRLMSLAGIEKTDTLNSIIDVSCGKGGGISFYKDFYNFKNYIGIDINLKSLEIAKNHTEGIYFYQASATDLPIKDNSIDVITCVEAFWYYKTIFDFINESHRVLKNNGMVLISTNMNKEEEEVIESAFINNGFMLYKKEDITKNVRISCSISKFRFLDISLQLAKALHSDEYRYYDNNTIYKNFVFLKV